MRTTLTIDDHLYREIKRRAVEQDRTITELVEEALRTLLHDTARSLDAAPQFPVFDPGAGSGTLPGVDLDDNAGLQDHIDGASGAPA